MPHRVRIHEGFVELELSGHLDSLERLAPGQLRAVLAARVLLYNYEAVATADFDSWQIAHALRRLATRGIRIAAYAPQPAWFGVNRQVIQIADLGPDRAQVFRERNAALAWLLGHHACGQ